MAHKKVHGDPGRSNYGAFRKRSAGHADRPKNWFRRAPHPKEK